MACPACGGSSREEIAPGYWRCTTPVTTITPGPGVRGMPWTGPAESSHSDVCGTAYHEGPAAAGAPVCACGTFAIGICVDCSKPRCGNCGAYLDGRFECREHIRARREKATAERQTAEATTRAAQQEADRANAQERQAALDEIAALVRALKAAGSPGAVKVVNALEYRYRSRRNEPRTWKAWPVTRLQVHYPANQPSAYSTYKETGCDHEEEILVTSDGTWLSVGKWGKRKSTWRGTVMPTLDAQRNRNLGHTHDAVDVVAAARQLRQIAESHDVSA
jgi:hypothetical protein